MCVVSVVTQSIPNQWGAIGNSPAWDYQTASTLQEILRRLDAIDKKMGATECTDPNKSAFLEALDNYVKAQRPSAP